MKKLQNLLCCCYCWRWEIIVDKCIFQLDNENIILIYGNVNFMWVCKERKLVLFHLKMAIFTKHTDSHIIHCKFCLVQTGLKLILFYTVFVICMTIFSIVNENIFFLLLLAFLSMQFSILFIKANRIIHLDTYFIEWSHNASAKRVSHYFNH